MKLVIKLALAIVAGMCLVLALFGWRSVQRERALFERDMQRDEHLLGRALGAAVETVWRVDGPEQALRMIRDASDREDGVQIRWVWLDAPPGTAHAPAVDAAALAGLAQGEEVVRIERGAESGRIYTYAPGRVDPARVGALELSESFAEEERYVLASVLSTFAAMGALVVVSGALATALGAWFVGGPVRSLVQKARRIGEGDLAGELVLTQRDELAELAREMNLMCERLSDARASVARETSARIAALEQLRHADRLTTVGKLASGIAHELGTPLNVVSGRAKMILRGPAPDDARDYARIIVEQVERMTNIIRQLLDFARHRRPHKAPADLAQVTAQTLSLLEPLARKHDVTLRLDASGAGGTQAARAEVDLGQMQQALTNLVMNGIQAMRAGGELVVTLGRERARPPVDHGGAEGEHVTIRVRDAGEGIPPEHLPRIFEPFFTTKDVGEGTGLGLSVTYGIVREHGGWIAVESEVNQGTTFTVYVPVGEDGKRSMDATGPPRLRRAPDDG